MDIEDDPGDWRLVHGFAALTPGCSVGVAHAWLTDGREVYDAVEDRFWPVTEYCGGRYEIRAIYTVREACNKTVETRHWGPWEIYENSPPSLKKRFEATSSERGSAPAKPTKSRVPSRNS